ncbi:hypothetical protein BA6E_105114 [Bacteroidales bacterium 6E]|nr:hypothetical protein BA6E_105114 [Bacteroidales bacterium 6E]
MRIAEITMFILVILLTLSVGLNVFQYTGKKVNSDPVHEIVTVSDTVVRVDTIYRELTHNIVVEKPVPVYVDTTANVRTYRDTIFLPYGTINREELVLGEILKQDLNIDFKIPETLRTMTVTNSTTQTIRSPLVFVTGGVRYNYSEKRLMPTVGLSWLTPGHQYFLGLYVSLDRTVSIKLGIRL